MTDPTGPQVSKRYLLQRPYQAIMDIAKAGDLLFFISDSGLHAQEIWRRRYRQIVGLHPLDTTNWHTTIYLGPRKDSRGGQFRPEIIHAVSRGTVKEAVPPSYMVNSVVDGTWRKHRIEVVTSSLVSDEQRARLAHYVCERLNRPFDGDGWQLDFRTYLFGIRSRRRNPDKVSCHGLAFLAYETIGFQFAHQLRSAPCLLARLVGHPLGHAAQSVNLAYNYLRDHHLYRDPRFDVSLAVAGGGETLSEVEISPNPGKYSWDSRLREVYGIRV